MYLTIILLACIFTVLTIILFKVNNINNQILIFLIISLTIFLYYLLSEIFYNINGNPNNIDNIDNNNINDNNYSAEELDYTIKNNVKLNANQKENDQYTSDGIIPIQSYNKDDCTNDNSCIIKADNYNLFPKNKNSVTDVDGELIPKNHCDSCGRILSLINNKFLHDIINHFNNLKTFRAN